MFLVVSEEEPTATVARAVAYERTGELTGRQVPLGQAGTDAALAMAGATDAAGVFEWLWARYTPEAALAYARAASELSASSA